MSRGFGPTFGTGTNTDVVISQNVAGPPTTRSYSMWVNINGKGGVNFGIQFIQGSSGNDFLQCNNSTGNLVFKSRWTTTTGQWSFNCAPQNTWQHIGITYDTTLNTNAPIVYINGVKPVVSVITNPTGANNPVTSAYNIGLNPPNNNGYLDGQMAEFAAWNGVILTAGEMQALAGGVNPLAINPQALITYMPLDGVNNPEPDIINGNTSAVTGTRLGTSAPPAKNVTQFYNPLIDQQLLAFLAARAAGANNVYYGPATT